MHQYLFRDEYKNVSGFFDELNRSIVKGNEREVVL